jgi:hypothetical protein
LLYAQVVKRYRRHRITQVRRPILLGFPENFRQTLTAHGFSGRIPWLAGERQRARAGRPPSLNVSI